MTLDITGSLYLNMRMSIKVNIVQLSKHNKRTLTVILKTHKRRNNMKIYALLLLIH